MEAKLDFDRIIRLTMLHSNQLFLGFSHYQLTKKGKCMNLGMGTTTHGHGRLCSKGGCLAGNSNNGIFLLHFKGNCSLA
ncbi:hypothetical protein CRYUN_Cryun20dG0048600 [Craigia yunnanensis]